MLYCLVDIIKSGTVTEAIFSDSGIPLQDVTFRREGLATSGLGVWLLVLRLLVLLADSFDIIVSTLDKIVAIIREPVASRKKDMLTVHQGCMH